ncbi:MAG: hypothetical protein EHM87_14640 [Burkholderiales bacterium]|nr:MAG: hypothetical protein EHM87_14640 [Burkholderiales bacterium]
MSADALPPGCDAVAAALARLDARPRVVLRAEVAAGRPADGVHSLALHRDGPTQRWVLDGRALRTMPSEGRASDALRLAPEGGCESDAATGDPRTVVMRYDAWAERGQSRVTLRVDAASGLPRDALRDGPELAWGRALSRPTKPPQAALRPTGGRLIERIDFDYPPPPPSGPDTGDSR